MNSRYLLAIDQGTTSTRAIMFNADGTPVVTAQRELPQIYPQPGWVEHDPEEIWQATLAVCRGAVARSGATTSDIAAIGITNQRETTVLWDRATGRAVHNAIVWQDRRTAPLCEELRRRGLEDLLRQRTGLLADPYFSATKLAWLLDTVPGARVAAERGQLAFGTIDSYLLFRLTGRARHLSDVTNAARTMLFDIHRQQWDPELLELFRIPAALLPEVRDNADDFGGTQNDILGSSLPIAGMAGDQQAATIGQTCLEPGMLKSTYGTGCFALLNTGAVARASQHRLLTTIAYRLGGQTTYALEGSIFIAGAAVQWLRDGLHLFANASETSALAQAAKANSEVVVVPAFTGLGAPYWDAGARGAMFGLTRDSGIAEIVRATLDSVAFQTRDLLQAMAADGTAPKALRVDGGMVANDWFAQRLADLCGVPVERPVVTETTALGAAYLAGLQVGLYDTPQSLVAMWKRDRLFEPALGADQRDSAYAKWQDAVKRVRTSQ